ncbi:MAG TPA: sigma-70 family RNA polymerase sigma factor [Streptosporangiaceae bacterium]|nr:sigma-70 family RNA polymerase sigma factor [Streptosporangiaceae bacterium]
MSESGEPASHALPSSDAELIKAVASGNAAAYATLHERHVAAARILARHVTANSAEAEEVLSETFTRLLGVLRRDNGPAEALRPFLLSAVRRVAQERGSTGAAVADAEIPSLGEPLFTDPEAAQLESARLALAFRALSERQRAALWYTEIEQSDPAEAAVLLGLTAEGVAGLRDQACAGLRQAYLAQHASGAIPDDCKAVAGKLGQHLANATRGGDEAMVQRHLRGCRECRAVVIELSACGRSLRATVAPIFLGPPAAAYLAAVRASPAPQGLTEAGWRRLLQIGQAPRRLLRATRQQQAFAGGIALLAVVGVTGLALTLAANSAPQPAAQHPAAIAPASPSAAAPSAAPQPTPAQPVATTMPAKKATAAASPSPAPASPAPTPSPSPSPASSPTPQPTPTPTPPPHHRHHRPPNAA